jgi:hypothetical protein
VDAFGVSLLPHPDNVATKSAIATTISFRTASSNNPRDPT